MQPLLWHRVRSRISERVIGFCFARNGLQVRGKSVIDLSEWRLQRA